MSGARGCAESGCETREAGRDEDVSNAWCESCAAGAETPAGHTIEQRSMEARSPHRSGAPLADCAAMQGEPSGAGKPRLGNPATTAKQSSTAANLRRDCITFGRLPAGKKPVN